MIGRPVARAARPGLISTAGRAAVVAGTATAVSGRVAARRPERTADAQAAAPPAAPPPPPTQAAPAATAASGGDTIDALERLGALRQQGPLDGAEFAAAKAKLLGGG